MNQIKQIFKIDKNPKRGLLPIEWLVMGYMLLTLLIVLFAYTRVENPQAMIWGRVRIAATTVALWGAYRLVPCRFTRAVRVVVQMALLAWWYPDTYEINRMFPNLTMCSQRGSSSSSAVSRRSSLQAPSRRLW